jgi:hypothetical protein
MPKTPSRGAFGWILCIAPIRLRDATDQFSTFCEFMLEIRGFHAPWEIAIPTESFMLHCNRWSQI